MRRYGNRSGSSGVKAYEVAGDAIAVQFADGRIYLYDYATTGRRHVENMKALAGEGRGLSTYISRHVGARYAARLQPP